MRVRSVVRSLFVTGLAAGLVAAVSGCWVGDEIDKASAMSKGPPAAASDKTGGTAATAKGGAAKPAAPKAGDTAAPSAKSWWQTARTLGSEESEAGIARCDLSGRTEFMLRDDCLARGGVPK